MSGSLYRLCLSEDERFSPEFRDEAFRRALVLLAPDERSKFIATYILPISARLVPPQPDSIMPDLQDCDLYTYGGLYFLFSERAISELRRMRDFADRLIPIVVEGRSTPLHMYYTQHGKRLITDHSEFKTSVSVGGISLPIGLVHAHFIVGARIDADAFLIEMPKDIVSPPRSLPDIFVTDHFRQAWEDAGLIGAQFSKIGDLPS